MFKKAFSLIGLLSYLAGAACSTLTIPTDYLTVSGLSRANLSSNFSTIQTAHNDCKDSLNLTLSRVTNWGAALTIKSLQDLLFQVDSDNNGANKFTFLSGTSDTLFKVSEDTTARFYK